MPILGADMEAGTLVAWRKQPGDRVTRGDIIAEVETDKADIEVEVFLDGVIEKLLIEEGTKVPVGTPLAVIREEGAAAQPVRAAAPAALESPKPPASPPARRPAAATTRGAPISPAARELARELSVDLATVTGTGPEGRVQRKDVLAAAHATKETPPTAGAPPAPPTPQSAVGARAEDRQARMRQAIAAAMGRSAREIPQFHITSTVDMTRAVAWLREENDRRPIAERLLYGVLLIKATALALREVPELNATWAGDHVELKGKIHTGLAISLRGGGLVAPAIHDADQRSLGQLMTAFRELVQRARAGSLRSSELSDPTVTITSLGETGAEAVYGLIYPPQVALVGFGRLHDRVLPVDNAIAVRPAIVATLTADHRVVDGHRGSVFLAALDRLLQEPSQL